MLLCHYAEKKRILDNHIRHIILDPPQRVTRRATRRIFWETPSCSLPTAGGRQLRDSAGERGDEDVSSVDVEGCNDDSTRSPVSMLDSMQREAGDTPPGRAQTTAWPPILGHFGVPCPRPVCICHEYILASWWPGSLKWSWHREGSPLLAPSDTVPEMSLLCLYTWTGMTPGQHSPAIYSPFSRVWVWEASRPRYRSTQRILVSLYTPLLSSSCYVRFLLYCLFVYRAKAICACLLLRFLVNVKSHLEAWNMNYSVFGCFQWSRMDTNILKTMTRKTEKKKIVFCPCGRGLRMRWVKSI